MLLYVENTITQLLEEYKNENNVDMTKVENTEKRIICKTIAQEANIETNKKDITGSDKPTTLKARKIWNKLYN